MKNKKLLKYLLITAGILIVFLIIGKTQGWIGKKPSIKVLVDTVKRRTIIESVSANGKIQPEVEVKLTPDVSGEVIELYVKDGDEVIKGQLLAKINPDIYLSTLDRMTASVNTSKANLANAKARLAQVQAQFTNAKAVFERNEKLWKQKAISSAEYEAAQASFQVSKAEVDASTESVNAADYNVKSAEAMLKEAKENLTKTSIFAPVSGTISKLNVEKGERVVGTSQFAGTEIMRIANLAEMEVNVDVNENDIVRVTLGDTAIVEVDAYLNRKFKGIVTEIANSANTTGLSADQVTNFQVKIRILRSSYMDLLSKNDSKISPFRPGMSATVDIQTETGFNVLTVPIQSVTTREDTTKKKTFEKKNENNQSEKLTKTENSETIEYAFVYDKGTVKQVKVKTGIQNNMYIHVKEGVNENQIVVSGPYRVVSKTLKDKDKVEIVSEKELYNTKK